MTTEELKIGRELQNRITRIEKEMKVLDGENYSDVSEKHKSKVNYITVKMFGNRDNVIIQPTESYYTDKARADLEYLNQIYRDNVIGTLEKCKEELEREFELLGGVGFEDLENSKP